MMGSKLEQIEELKAELSDFEIENKNLSKEVSELKIENKNLAEVIHKSVMENFHKNFKTIRVRKNEANTTNKSNL